MKSLLVSLVATLAAAVVLAGCTQAAPPPAPTAAPPAPTKAAAQPTKAAEPTKAAAQPTKAAEPTKAAAQPTKAAAPAPTAVPSSAVDFPAKGKIITLISPWAAGGANDGLARVLAAGLQNVLGTEVIVVNREGASSQVAFTEMVRCKPDGYTTLLAGGMTNMLAYMNPDRKAVYSRKDFIPVAQATLSPLALAVKADGKYKTLKDLIDAAKAKPGGVSVSVVGLLSATHMVVLGLQKLADVQFAVPDMSNAPQASTAVLGDHIDAATGGAGNWTSLVKNNQLHYLALTDQSKFFPDVKTFEAQGYKLYGGTSAGIVVPAGTPKEVVATLSRAVKKAVTEDEMVKQKIDGMAIDVRYMDTPEFEAFWDNTEAALKPALEQALKELKTK